MIVDQRFVRWMILVVVVCWVAIGISMYIEYQSNKEYLEQHRITHVNQAEIIRLLKEKNCHG